MSELVACQTLHEKYRHLRPLDSRMTLCDRQAKSVFQDVSSRPLCPECEQRSGERKSRRRYPHRYERGGLDIVMTFWISKEDKRLLIEAAKKSDCTVAEKLRTYVTWGLETEEKT